MLHPEYQRKPIGVTTASPEYQRKPIGVTTASPEYQRKSIGVMTASHIVWYYDSQPHMLFGIIVSTSVSR